MYNFGDCAIIDMMASAGEDAASPIMVFRPTLAEFSDFSSYITHMEGKGAHQYGIAKVSRAPKLPRGCCGRLRPSYGM